MKSMAVWLALVALVVLPPLSSAQELFPAGTENKAAGIPSSLGCGGPSCINYNPANLRAAGLQPSIEIGYIQAQQTYEHPNFDKVSVTVRSGIGSLGLLYRPQMSPWTIGFYLLPLSYGKQEINGLPRRIAGRFESLFVENEATTYELSAGGSYHLNDFMTLGLSLIRRSEQRKIYATRVNDDTTLIRYNGHNDFYTPVAGITVTPVPTVKWGLSYRPARSKTYKGKQKAATDDKVTSPRNTTYDPAVVYNSVNIHPFAEIAFRINWNRLFYGRGRNKVREGLTSQVQRADLKDVDERSFEAIYRVMPTLELSAAYGVSPSPWGAGFYSDDHNAYVIGTDFGTANNVTRRIYALGAKYAGRGGWAYSASYMDASGKREIGPAGDKPGYYSSLTRTLSLSLSKSF